MKQVSKNLTDPLDGFLGAGAYVLLDRDTKYCDAFREILTQSKVEIVRLPVKSPNLNAFIERFIRSLKEECLDCLIFFGEPMLRKH